ncbi:MAG: NAD(P)-dependent oxidoreductase [Candidatus Pacearchaeota archaeon]
MKNKLIFITGSHGGLGSDLVDLFKEKKVNFYESESDINERDSIFEEMKIVNPDIVIHFAAMVGTKDCEEVPRQAVETNVMGTLNVVEAAKSIGAKFVYFSTTAIYKPGINPIKEDSLIAPYTIYGKTKLWGEEIAKTYIPKNDLLIVRPCFGFGGRTDVSMLGALIRSHYTHKHINLLLDMHNYKDYTYVRNITNYVYLLIEMNAFGNDFNISQGEARPYIDVIRKLNKKKIYPHFYNFPDLDYMGSHVVDNTKLIKYTGKKPLYSFEEGLDIIIRQYEKNKK